MLERLRNFITTEFSKDQEEFWHEIQSQAKTESVSKNEILVRYYSKSQDVYFVESGSFVCSQISDSGKSTAIWFYFSDIFENVACVDSYFNGENTKYEIKALEDSTVTRFHKSTIDSWFNKYDAFKRFYVESIIQDFLTIFEARSSLLTFTSLEFLQYTKTRFPFIFDRLPAHMIADFMGITPEWYSKLQKKLES